MTRLKIWIVSIFLPEGFEIVPRKYTYKAITLDKKEYSHG